MNYFDLEKFKRKEQEYKFLKHKKNEDELKNKELPEDTEFLEKTRSDDDAITERDKRIGNYSHR